MKFLIVYEGDDEAVAVIDDSTVRSHAQAVARAVKEGYLDPTDSYNASDIEVSKLTETKKFVRHVGYKPKNEKNSDKDKDE